MIPTNSAQFRQIFYNSDKLSMIPSEFRRNPSESVGVRRSPSESVGFHQFVGIADAFVGVDKKAQIRWCPTGIRRNPTGIRRNPTDPTESDQSLVETKCSGSGRSHDDSGRNPAE